MKFSGILSIWILISSAGYSQEVIGVGLLSADTSSVLKISLENDLLTLPNSDRYFTSGITIDMQARWLGIIPLQKIMIPYGNNASKNYNIYIVQDIYTPTDSKIAPAMKGDRPYSSTLYIGYRQSVIDPIRKLKISSQLDAGLIGPYTPGSFLQKLVHKSLPDNAAPMGWETQINTDLILNYNSEIMKAIIANKNTTLFAGLDIKAGTLYDNIGAGLQLQKGNGGNVFRLASKDRKAKIEYYLFAKIHISFVAYNALLQGGMFNHNNIFTLKAGEICRVVANSELGIHVEYKSIGIDLVQHHLTPEYKGGLWHKWGEVSVTFRF